ncbi:MAG: Ig domain-containing protein [Velocimicrobium sp.]
MKIKKKLFSLILIATLIIAQAVPIQAATSVRMNKTKVSLYVGTRTKLSLKTKTRKTLVWKSSDTSIVKVSKRGSIKAVKAGKATITVKLKGTKQKAKCSVVVGAYATTITLDSAGTVILDAGKTSQIKAGVAPNTVLTSALIFTSKDSSIATVDKEGVITAVSTGLTEVTIKAKAVNKKKHRLTKTIQVVVNQAANEQDTSGGGDSGSPGGGSGDGGGTQPTALVNTITSGTTKTYILNKSYTDSVTVGMTVNGQTWKYTGKVNSILNNLCNTYTTETNTAGTICATRNVGDEWWTLTDPSNQNALLFKVKADLTSDGNTNYGQIVIEQGTGTVTVTVY